MGILVNCLAFVPVSFLQAIGKPSIPAKLHVLEFPFYAGILYLGLRSYGHVGAAFAWFARVLVDSILLHIISYKILNGSIGRLE